MPFSILTPLAFGVDRAKKFRPGNANKTARGMQRSVEARLSATLRRDRPYAAKINDAATERARSSDLSSGYIPVGAVPFLVYRYTGIPVTQTLEGPFSSVSKPFLFADVLRIS